MQKNGKKSCNKAACAKGLAGSLTSESAAGLASDIAGSLASESAAGPTWAAARIAAPSPRSASLTQAVAAATHTSAQDMPTYTVRSVSDFDLDHTFDCGQCFRWVREADGSYTGVVGRHVASISYADGDLVIKNATPADYDALWRDYLDIERDYSAIKKKLCAHDDVMAAAVRYGAGIRLLRQDPWESVVSFIISQNSNIPRIKKCIEALCESFGEYLGTYRGKERYAFPDAATLASLDMADLADIHLGYRDRYVLEVAKKVASDGGRALAAARDSSREEAERYVSSFVGVGPKVANCIMLFGLGKYDSFPLDVWMKRIMSELYGFHENDLRGMSEYAREHFGEYSGFAQQYLFYYARENL